MNAPIVVDTETFTDSFDFVGFARRLLSGHAGGSLPGDQGPLDWLLRALPLVQGTSYEDRLTRAVSECLTDGDPTVRREALRFFEARAAAAGAERVVELARGDRKLFAGVPDPETKSIDLEWSLLRAVGARMVKGDERAKGVGREEALKETGQPEPLIAALTTTDSQWVIAHCEEIVAKHPKTASTILFNLEQAGVGAAEVGERIAASAAAGDRNFRADVKRYLNDEQVKTRILAASKRRGS